VAQRQPDERAARVWVQVRRALAAQVRQEQQPLGAGRDRVGLGDQRVEVRAGQVAPPAQRAARRQRDGHQVERVRHGVAEGVDAARRVGRERVAVREEHAAGADRGGHRAFAHDADADRRGGVVAAARGHRQPVREPELGGHVVAQRAGHLRALVDVRQPLARDLQRVEDLR
jgi:hypothetical protein